MIWGCAVINIANLLISESVGFTENSKETALRAFSIGLIWIVVCVTKMDKIKFEQDAF